MSLPGIPDWRQYFTYSIEYYLFVIDVIVIKEIAQDHNAKQQRDHDFVRFQCARPIICLRLTKPQFE